MSSRTQFNLHRNRRQDLGRVEKRGRVERPQREKNLTILNTYLVYSDKPTHLIHYVAQKVAKGSIAAPFLSDATFRPISSDDVASAVAHKLLKGGHGSFALRGEKELTIK